jgi:hypothetical protein
MNGVSLLCRQVEGCSYSSSEILISLPSRAVRAYLLEVFHSFVRNHSCLFYYILLPNIFDRIIIDPNNSHNKRTEP